MANNPNPSVKRNLSVLRHKVVEGARQRVIVGVRAPFAPEGQLHADEVRRQRSDIARAQAAVLAKLRRPEQANGHRYAYIPYVAMDIDAEQLEDLAAALEVTDIVEDRLESATLTQSVPLINADDAWGAGYSGIGWAVAVLDNGIQNAHPFLSSAIVSEACYSTTQSDPSRPENDSISLCPGGVSASTEPGSASNCTNATYGNWACGHGTHVGGIVLGRGSVAGKAFSGVAKNASLISIQVFSWFPSATDAFTWTSDQIKGLERVYALRSTYNIAAVNMSIGGGRHFVNCDDDPQKTIIDQLRSVGIATIISTGNNGYTDSVASPSCISSSVSVGSTWDSSSSPTSFSACSNDIGGVNKVACYSNAASFMDLLAPGSAIESSVPTNSYATYHGTSMAAPHVAGCWAILKAAAPAANVDQIETALKNTGVSVTDYRNTSLSKPRIDCKAALDSLLASSTPTYTLTVTASGADSVPITASPSQYGGTTGYDKAGIASGTAITLTAPASHAGMIFANWQGCNATTSTQCNVTLTANKTVTANFQNPAGTTTNLVQNPGFESGAAAWTEYAYYGYDIISNLWGFVPHSGNYLAWLGGIDGAYDYIEQTVAIPANARNPTLQFWYKIDTIEPGPDAYDFFYVDLYGTGGAFLARLATLSNLNQTSDWAASSVFDLSAWKGQSVKLRFSVTNDIAYYTDFFVDDIALNVTTRRKSNIAPILMLLLD
jgi:subtilisin family serine protease